MPTAKPSKAPSAIVVPRLTCVSLCVAPGTTATPDGRHGGRGARRERCGWRGPPPQCCVRAGDHEQHGRSCEAVAGRGLAQRLSSRYEPLGIHLLAPMEGPPHRGRLTS
jgi:hypothetical protein